MAETAVDLETRVRRALEYLRPRLDVRAAVVFGSRVEGRAGPFSDIDLAVFSPDVERMTLDQRVRVMADVRLHCDVDVELHLFSARALRESRKTNFAGYILETGKRIF